MAAAPIAGHNCVSTDGKINGRGSTLQLWLVFDLMGQYTNDICGGVASQGANDVTDPSNPSLPTGVTFGANWMLAYDYPNAQAASGTGSGQGQSAMTCHSDAFGGTDIPATKAQLTTMNGTPGTCVANIQNGTDPPPFTPQGTFPNLGDTGSTGGRGNATNSVMSVPIGASAVGIAADLPTDCLTTGNTATTQPMALTTADQENIWGGIYTDWSQLVAADPNTGLAAGCSGAITRVVREDNSGTTQGFDNYLSEIGTLNGTTVNTCDPSNANVSTLGALTNNQANNGTDQLWPGGAETPAQVPAAGTAMNFTVAGCSHLISAALSGANQLVNTLNATSGGVGYADVSDIDHDPNLNATNDNLTLATVQGADGSQQSPLTGTFASGIFGSNCNFNGATLPGGGSAGAVGLVNLALANPGGWILGSGNTKDDISFSHQSGAYPICSLTWDFVWSGEDGNTPSTPTASDSVTGGVLQVSSLAGLPNSGSFTDAGNTFNYTGLSNSATTCGGTSTACVTGVTGSGTVATGDTLTWPQGTGGPLANLTADQRRTLYTYYLWLFSAEGQASEVNVGYAPLPTSWQTSILAGFKSGF